MIKKNIIIYFFIAVFLSTQMNFVTVFASPQQKSAEQILQERINKKNNININIATKNEVGAASKNTEEKQQEIFQDKSEVKKYEYKPSQAVIEHYKEDKEVEKKHIEELAPVYNFDWHGTPLSQSLYAISKIANKKLILNGDLKGTVYATLTDVTYSSALNYLASAFGFNWMKIDDAIVISTDSAMPQTRRFNIRYVDINKVKDELKTLNIGDSHIYANPETNSVTVSGSSYQLVQAKRLIQSLDYPVPQVLIYAQLVELSHGKDLDLGFSYGLPTYEHEAKTSTSNSTVSDFAGNFLEKLTFSTSVTAEKALSKGKVVSRPMLLAKNGQKATTFMGAQVPIPSNSYNNGSNDITFTYQPVGSSIIVTPTVDMLTGEINMKLTAEISNITRYITSGNMSVPEISSRKAETEVRLKSGQSFCIGGLMTTQDLDNLSGIPGLMNLPILGSLFRHHVKSKENTEVFLLITPYIVEDGINAEEILRQQGKYHDTEDIVSGHTYKSIDTP